MMSKKLPSWRRFVWRYPGWWVTALSAGAWGLTLAGAEGMHCSAPLVGWTIMVFAMMLPLASEHIHQAAVGSLWARRHVAIGDFLVGYFAIWLSFGVVANAILITAGRYWPPKILFIAALSVAALWQCTAWKRRALRACHLSPALAPRGWGFHRDCLRYGCLAGGACAGSCWPLMLACAAAGHGTAVMLLFGIVSWIERDPYVIPRWWRKHGRLTVSN